MVLGSIYLNVQYFFRTYWKSSLIGIDWNYVKINVKISVCFKCLLTRILLWRISVISSTLTVWSRWDIFLRAEETIQRSPLSSLTRFVTFSALYKTSTLWVYGLYRTAKGRWICSANILQRTLTENWNQIIFFSLFPNIYIYQAQKPILKTPKTVYDLSYLSRKRLHMQFMQFIYII